MTNEKQLRQKLSEVEKIVKQAKNEGLLGCDIDAYVAKALEQLGVKA